MPPVTIFKGALKTKGSGAKLPNCQCEILCEIC